MNVTEMLERIEKLPTEWKHPLATLRSDGACHIAGIGYVDNDTLALDLHLRTIAERLAKAGVGAWPRVSGGWWADTGEDEMPFFDTYALALLSAAEAVVKEGGANAT